MIRPFDHHPPREAPGGPTWLATYDSLAPAMHVLLRVGAGLLFMQHGAQKLFGWLADASIPLVSLMGVAGVLEFFGGLMIVVGLFTRPVAFLLAGEMVVAYLIAHLPQGPWPILNKGELSLLFALIFGYLAFWGAGPASVDAYLRSPVDERMPPPGP